MDLGTMTKKVKSQQYRSSEEFIRDLYLIYANCFEYNTDPKSIYRYHAQKMKEKSDELLEEFPDYQAEDGTSPDPLSSSQEFDISLSKEGKYVLLSRGILYILIDGFFR
jgi:hypothetical protein